MQVFENAMQIGSRSRAKSSNVLINLSVNAGNPNEET